MAMRPIYLLACLLVTCLAHGQLALKSNPPRFRAWEKGQWLAPPDRQVSLKAEKISLGDLFTSIWKQVQMHAFFSEEILDPDSIIKADFNQTPLDTILAYLLRSRGLVWKYYEDCFVILERDSSKRNIPAGSIQVALRPGPRPDKPMKMAVASPIDEGATAKPATENKAHGTIAYAAIKPAERKVTISGKGITIREVFRRIACQADIYAFFPEWMLNSDIMLDIDFNQAPLDSLLAFILRPRGLQWKYDDRIFTLSKHGSARPLTEESNLSALTRNKLPARKIVEIKAKRSDGPTRHYQADEKIWIKQPGIAEVMAYEQSIGSGIAFMDIGFSTDFYPLMEKYPVTLTPLVAERWEAKGHLPICARYYYCPEDSVVRLITYDWLRLYESAYTDDQQKEQLLEQQKIRAEEDGKIISYRKELERIRRMVVQRFGPPTLSTTDESIWDRRYYYASLKFTFTPDAHRIRLKLYWKPEACKR